MFGTTAQRESYLPPRAKVYVKLNYSRCKRIANWFSENFQLFSLSERLSAIREASGITGRRPSWRRKRSGNPAAAGRRKRRINPETEGSRSSTLTRSSIPSQKHWTSSRTMSCFQSRVSSKNIRECVVGFFCGLRLQFSRRIAILAFSFSHLSDILEGEKSSDLVRSIIFSSGHQSSKLQR